MLKVPWTHLFLTYEIKSVHVSSVSVYVVDRCATALLCTHAESDSCKAQAGCMYCVVLPGFEVCSLTAACVVS